MRIDAGAWSPWGRAVRLTRQIDSILYAEFARRRKEGVEGRADVLSMLLAAHYENEQPLPDNVIRDEMYTLMLAGHETTAATMAWVINRLVTNPEVMERARAEVLSVLDGQQLESSHVGKLKYVEAVINETMRLDPVIPNFGRTLTRPLKIAGRDLPAGVTIAPCIYLVHRRPELWPNPEQFNPDRFLEGRQSPYTFFPFGGGARRCLGAAFATYQMKIVIAEILSRVDLKPVPGYKARATRRGIAFAPSDGLPVVATQSLKRETASFASSHVEEADTRPRVSGGGQYILECRNRTAEVRRHQTIVPQRSSTVTLLQRRRRGKRNPRWVSLHSIAMTPEDKKLITVLTRLYAKTKADVVEWEPSEDANIFGVKFSDYTISLVRILATPTHAEWFNLTIANSDGAVIQEMDSLTARDNGFADMSDLFYRARRHAVDLDGALDDLLKELDDLSGEKS